MLVPSLFPLPRHEFDAFYQLTLSNYSLADCRQRVIGDGTGRLCSQSNSTQGENAGQHNEAMYATHGKTDPFSQPSDTTATFPRFDRIIRE